jgi:hypothetical protein
MHLVNENELNQFGIIIFDSSYSFSTTRLSINALTSITGISTVGRDCYQAVFQNMLLLSKGA